MNIFLKILFFILTSTLFVGEANSAIFVHLEYLYSANITSQATTQSGSKYLGKSGYGINSQTGQ